VTFSATFSAIEGNLATAPPMTKTMTTDFNMTNGDSTKGNHMSVERSSTDKEETIDCPLFMDGLPSDFAENPALAALASFLDEDSCKEKPAVKKSDGITVRRKTMHVKHKCYQSNIQKEAKRKQQPNVSVGEAQLFFSMWKI